jgi:lipoate-protein ligase B
LVSNRLDVRWVSRGGGCVLHAPGQLAVYPIVPLERFGWSVGEYLKRFQAGLVASLEGFRMALTVRPERYGIWARSGQLVTMAAAVRNWVSWQGAFINVAPPMDLVRKVLDPVDHVPMSSLAVERQQVIKMTDLRTRLVPALAGAFECDRFQIYTGHPLMREVASQADRGARRVG